MAELLRVLAWPAGDPKDLNPYVRRMYMAFRSPDTVVFPFRPLMAKVPASDIFHIHWPEGIFAGAGGRSLPIAMAKAVRVLAVVRRLRRNGGKLVLTAHNVSPHQRFQGWQRLLWKAYYARLLGQVDHVIALSSASLADYRAANPSVRTTDATIIAHPHYRRDYPVVSRGTARRAWNIPDDRWVLGMVGSIRQSKHIDAAAEMFLKIRRADEMFFVAGGADDDRISERLSTLAAKCPDGLRVATEHLDDAQFASAVAASDACLINQAGTLNSGTALVTLSLDRPLIAPAVGTLSSLATEIAGGWITLFTLPVTEASLRACLDTLRARPPVGQPDLDHLEPEDLSRAMRNAFGALVFK